MGVRGEGFCLKIGFLFNVTKDDGDDEPSPVCVFGRPYSAVH